MPNYRIANVASLSGLAGLGDTNLSHYPEHVVGLR